MPIVLAASQIEGRCALTAHRRCGHLCTRMDYLPPRPLHATRARSRNDGLRSSGVLDLRP